MDHGWTADGGRPLIPLQTSPAPVLPRAHAELVGCRTDGRRVCVRTTCNYPSPRRNDPPPNQQPPPPPSLPPSSPTLPTASAAAAVEEAADQKFPHTALVLHN